MGFEESKKATVAIYSQSGAIVGMGFLVSEKYVLTCAHVVKTASNNKVQDDSTVISITFPFVSRKQKYRTNIVGYWLEETGETGQRLCHSQTPKPSPLLRWRQFA